MRLPPPPAPAKKIRLRRGILCGIPDKFMRRVASEMSVELPPPRQTLALRKGKGGGLERFFFLELGG